MRSSPNPGGRRLLVHSLHPSCPLKMLDLRSLLFSSPSFSPFPSHQMPYLRSGSVMQSYPDIQSFRPPAPSTISPCGSWVLGGSSCGLAIAWNTDTGEKTHVWKEASYAGPVSALAFHPLEHAVVVAGGEPLSKVVVFTWDKASAKLLEEVDQQVVQVTPRQPARPPGYPQAQVARLIQEGGKQQQQAGLEGGSAPVDLQDIVEKLNAALVLCRTKNNLQLEDSHGQEDFYNKN